MHRSSKMAKKKKITQTFLVHSKKYKIVPSSHSLSGVKIPISLSEFAQATPGPLYYETSLKNSCCHQVESKVAFSVFTRYETYIFTYKFVF